MHSHTQVYVGAELARYHFGAWHPFGPARHDAFAHALQRQPFYSRLDVRAPARASDAEITMFHTPEYLEQVKSQSAMGRGYLDSGDTPAVQGIFEAAATVVGTTLAATRAIMAGDCQNAFVPIGGLHHAQRDRAAGFCVFNDCGVAIELLLRDFDLKRIAYVDIDAHHGDGVYDGFAGDSRVYIADLHEDGRYLYPGTGGSEERGSGAAIGTKLNIPMAPHSSDQAFLEAWEQVEAFIAAAKPDFVILQCGADSLAGDPLTHLLYSAQCHRHAAARLRRLADTSAAGRFLALGGGGYNLENIAVAWCAVVEQLSTGNSLQKDE